MEGTRMDKWDSIIYILLIGITIFVGKFVKTRFKFFNKLVLPTALLGGLIGLLLSSEVIPGSYYIDKQVMESIVYHALAIGFIALALKDKQVENKRKVWSTGMIITSTYALQGFIGSAIVLLFFVPTFIGAGLLLPLGFGQGPALAISFGSNWSAFLGGHGVALGASFAFLGFLWGGIIGVVAINYFARKKGLLKPTSYEEKASSMQTIEIETVKEISILDGLTTQVVVLSVIYGLVWLTLTILESVLLPIGGIGKTIFDLLSGFNFVIGIGYALIYKLILKRMQAKGRNVRFMTNNYILSNISSTAFNYMIAGGVLTITVSFFQQFGVLLLVVSTVGGLATLLYTRFVTWRVYPKFKDEYFVALFGNLTGVASTGIALLKGLDPKLETPVAEELVLGAGTAMLMALPLFVILLLPANAANSGGDLATISLVTLFGCLAYTLVMFTILMIRSRKSAISK
jgi:ESS family glutamate:Na+ symporter